MNALDARRRRHPRGARLALVLALTVAGCDGTGQSTPTSDQRVVESPTQTPTQTPSPVLGLRAPVAAPQTLTVLNGYDNPAPTEACPRPKGYGHDHCENQQYGLDLVPSDPADTRILAPIGGTIRWRGVDNNEGDCLGLEPTDTTLNLTICHFDQAPFVRTGDSVAVGTVLGLRNPAADWIHMSLDDRSSASWMPVPFYDKYWIEGHAFPARSLPVFNLYCGTTITSTNLTVGLLQPEPGSTHAATVIDCAGLAPTAAPTPTATAKPTPTPTVTPPPPPPPAPTNVTITWLLYGNDEVDTVTIRWRGAVDPTVKGFRIYDSSVFINDSICGPEVPCADPPCPNAIQAATVDPDIRQFVLHGPFGTPHYRRYCGTWVAAYNDAGESRRVEAIRIETGN